MPLLLIYSLIGLSCDKHTQLLYHLNDDDCKQNAEPDYVIVEALIAVGDGDHSKVYDEVCAKLLGTGAVILPKSSPRELAVNSIRCAAAMKNKMDDLRSENKMLRDMVNEMKLVNRAKCVLIEYLKISEKEAHRQIQKRAMDQRVTLTEVAADILKTYEYR